MGETHETHEMGETQEMGETGETGETGEMGKNSRVAPPALNVEKNQLVWLPFSQSVNNIDLIDLISKFGIANFQNHQKIWRILLTEIVFWTG